MIKHLALLPLLLCLAGCKEETRNIKDATQNMKDASGNLPPTAEHLSQGMQSLAKGVVGAADKLDPAALKKIFQAYLDEKDQNVALQKANLELQASVANRPVIPAINIGSGESLILRIVVLQVDRVVALDTKLWVDNEPDTKLLLHETFNNAVREALSNPPPNLSKFDVTPHLYRTGFHTLSLHASDIAGNKGVFQLACALFVQDHSGQERQIARFGKTQADGAKDMIDAVRFWVVSETK